MTGLKVIDGTPTEISKFLKEKKSQEENNVCECGHTKEEHKVFGVECFKCLWGTGMLYQLFHGRCQKFTPKNSKERGE